MVETSKANKVANLSEGSLEVLLAVARITHYNSFLIQEREIGGRYNTIA